MDIGDTQRLGVGWFRRVFLRIAAPICFRLTVLLTKWMQRNAASHFRLMRDLSGLAFSHENANDISVCAGINDIDKSQLDVKYEKHSEQGFNTVKHDNTLRLEGASLRLPLWAQEIQPFLLNQLSVHTRRAYETDLKQFFLFLEGKLDARNLESLRPEHIILYRKALEEGRITGRTMAQASINRKLAVVKSFLQWLQANKIISENPGSLVKGFPQTQESKLVGFSDEEVRRILALPDTNRKSGALHFAILSVLLYLGLRKGELIGLKMGDWDTDRGTEVLRVRGKGHRVRVLPLTPTLKAALEHYLWANKRTREDKEAPLFMPTKNPRFGVLHKKLNPHAITYLVIRYAKKAGVLATVSPHSCRATCISNALDKRATHRSVQHLAGWSTPLMIQRYDKRREDLKNSAAFVVDYGEEKTPKAC